MTCQAQPALGMVFKLVELDGKPRIKLSQETAKITIPGRKEAYRLIGENGNPILDLLMGCDEATPKAGVQLLCRHPLEEMRRVYVTPSKIIKLHQLVWDGAVVGTLPTLAETRAFVQQELTTIRPDILRPLNPTPYKVAVSSELYDYLHELWMQEIPIAELK